MKTIILFSLVFCSTGFSSEALFKERRDLSGLKANEVGAFNAMKNSKTAKLSKLIEIDESALSSGSVELGLFDGEKESFELKLTKDGQDSIWRGILNNQICFSLRKMNGRYTGFIFLNGINYVITPIAKGASVLVEEDGSFRCPKMEREIK